MSKLLNSVVLLICLACSSWPRTSSGATDYAAIVVDADSGAVLESVAPTAR